MNIQQRRLERRKRRRERKYGEKGLLEERITRRHRYPHFIGVGSALEFIIYQRYDAHACGGCLTLRDKMNRKGPDWCRQHIKEIAQDLHENVKKLQNRGNAWIKFQEKLAYATMGLHFHIELINEAINLYETTSTEPPENTPVVQ